MLSTRELWVEIGAIFSIALLIPAYMGFIHVGVAGAAAYAAIGGVAMTLAEELHFPPKEREIRLSDIALRIAAVAGLGGVAYVLALIFI